MKMCDNTHYYDKYDKKINYTLRIKNLTAIIRYLDRMKRYDDIKSVVNEVISWKMDNQESLLTNNWLFEKLHGNSNNTYYLSIYDNNFKDFVENFRPDIINYKGFKSSKW